MNQHQLVLRPLIRLSKTKIREIIGKALDYQDPYKYVYVRNDEKCKSSGCPIQKRYLALAALLQQEKLKDIPDFLTIRELTNQLESLKNECISSSCSNMTIKKVYQNDNSKYNLYHKLYAGKRLPKSTLRLYFLLYSIPQEKLGNTHIIRNISLETLSKALNVEPSTILKSLHKLEAFYYVTLSHSLSLKHFNIIINDYDNMHLPAKQGGSGYITISDSMMWTLLSKTNVNDLRLEVLALLGVDDKERLTGEKYDSYKIHDLKNILPAHMNYGKNYKDLMKTQPSNFLRDVSEGLLTFTLQNNLSMRVNSELYNTSRLTSIKNLLKQKQIPLYNPELLDSELSSLDKGILLLVHEYCDEHIVNAIQYIFKHYEMSSINVFGALLRTICQQFYSTLIA